MKCTRKNGFTLVELMVSIVVLSVVLVIATNLVLSYMNKAKARAFVDQVKQYIKAIDTDSVDKKTYDEYVVYTFPEDRIINVDKQPDSGFIIKNEDNKYRASIWDSKLKKCAQKNFDESEVTIAKDITSESVCNAFVSGKNIIGKKVSGIVGYEVLDSNGNDAVIKASCYTVNNDGTIDNYDAANCGPVFITPEKVGDKQITGFSYAFTGNVMNKDLTGFYVSDVSGITDLPSGLMANVTTLKNVYIANNENLTSIPAGFCYNAKDLDEVTITNLPKLTSISSGDFMYQDTSNPSTRGRISKIELSNLPKLENISTIFGYIETDSITIKNLDTIQSINQGAFNEVNGNNIRLVIEDNDNLTTITNAAFNRTSGYDGKYSYISISNNKKLSSLEYGGPTNMSYNNAEIYITNNNALSQITDSAFQTDSSDPGTIKKLVIKNNPSLLRLSNSAFSSSSYVNGEIIIENNNSLVELTNGSLYMMSGTIDKLSISNNPSFTTIQSGAVSGGGGGQQYVHVKELVIKNNPVFSSITNGAFFNLEVDKATFENNPSWTSLSENSSFSNIKIDTLDLSKLPLTTIPTSSGIASCTINTLILPPTLTTFNTYYVSSGVKESLYASGSDRCALNSYFINYGSGGAIESYNCTNPSILPVCN